MSIDRGAAPSLPAATTEGAVASGPSPDGLVAQQSSSFLGIAGRSIASASAAIMALPQAAEEDAFAGLTALGPVPSERKARDWALVLQSMSIWHVIRRPHAGWILLVRDGDYGRAAEAIDGYEAENRDWPPRPVRERPRHTTSPIAPALFAALVAFFVITGPSSSNSRWFQRGTAVTDLVLSSEPWRAVTALTLHGDGLHVLGNAISGTVFATAVHRRLGPGGSALAILLSGILGNVANAFYHHHIGEGMHGSIGASTAVFGAIGVLAATQVALNRPTRTEPRPWTDIAGPIVGGLALLGALGSGGDNASGVNHTDLGAHLFGLLSGIAIGLVAALPLRSGTVAVNLDGRYATNAVQLGAGAPRAWMQTVLGAVALAIVIVSWQLAFRR